MDTTFQTYLEAFACPHRPFDEDFYQQLVETYYQAFLGRFLQASEGKTASLAPGLFRFLQNAAPLSLERVWHPSFGNLRDHLRPENQGTFTLGKAADIALWLSFKGQTGSFELELPEARSFWFAGKVLPACIRLAVDSGATQVTFHLKSHEGEQDWVYDRMSRSWSGASLAEDVPFFTIGGTRVEILPRQAKASLGLSADNPLILDQAEGFAAVCQSAIDHIAEFSPVYLPWLERVLRYVVPLEYEGYRMHSWNTKQEPGLIHLSFVPNPPAIAEMLIHEGTHQYYNLLTMLEPVEDGSDPTLYYSPVKECGRPVWAILLAYHAFANVALFYRHSLEAGWIDDGYLLRNEKSTLPQVKRLEMALEETSALSMTGKALFEPLREVLHAHIPEMASLAPSPIIQKIPS